jgi:hypothetical protein
MSQVSVLWVGKELVTKFGCEKYAALVEMLLY